MTYEMRDLPVEHQRPIPYTRGDLVTKQEREVRLTLASIAVLRAPDKRRVLSSGKRAFRKAMKAC